MNPPSQNPQEPKPNFDFITQQGTPASHHQKRFSKKVIVLFILCGVTILTLIVGWIISASDNVVQNNQVEKVSLKDAEATIKDFLAKTAADDYDGAYQNVAPTPDSEDEVLEILTRELYETEAVPILKALKLEECTLTEDNTAENLVVFGCPSNSEDVVTNLEFVMTKQGNATKIVYYRLGVSA